MKQMGIGCHSEILHLYDIGERNSIKILSKGSAFFRKGTDFGVKSRSLKFTQLRQFFE